jgi:hypothetical protein
MSGIYKNSYRSAIKRVSKQFNLKICKDNLVGISPKKMNG